MSKTSKALTTLEQEKKLLNITLDYVNRENNDLKNKIEDLKMTVIQNKLLLDEYVATITNKDEVVHKMSNTIDTLTNRLINYEDYIKVLYVN